MLVSEYYGELEIIGDFGPRCRCWYWSTITYVQWLRRHCPGALRGVHCPHCFLPFHLYLRRLHLQEHHDLTVIGYGDIFPGRSEVSLPFGLQRLTFVAYYAQSTEKVSLPPGPQSSAVNNYSDQSTEKMGLPIDLQ